MQKVSYFVKLIVFSLAKLTTRDSKPCGLRIWAQKIEAISKGNDFEILYLKPETKIHVP